MKTRIPEYKGPFRVLSLALDERTREELLSEDVELLYVYADTVVVYPDRTVLTRDEKVLAQLRECHNYDVFTISDNGVLYQYYDDSSTENALFITEKCNSNCIMCPSPDSSRRRGGGMDIDDLISIVSHIPSDTPHITVTGGEPFMAGKRIFELFSYCREKFNDTEFLILTNARIFAIQEYCQLLKDTLPQHSVIGVPIHGSYAELHDYLTRSDNSFRQTMTGLERLQKLGIPLEIRVVVCRPNVEDLDAIARLIISSLRYVDHVVFMAMEMTGNAYVNGDLLWIPYRESFRYVKTAVDLLVGAGINVRLYNYPLCTVDPEYHLICEKSISSWKVRFDPVCDACTLRDSCGGVFAGSYRLESNELEAL